jgi:hypothetical protein
MNTNQQKAKAQKEETPPALKALIGLFFPVKIDREWRFTIAIGGVPLGWIIVVIAYFV